MIRGHVILAAGSCGLFLAPTLAWADSTYIAPDGFSRVPPVVVLCPPVAGSNVAVPCSSGNGVVSQGTAGTQPWLFALPNGAAQDGVDASGIAQAAGGAGIRGWLSTLASLLRGTLSVGGTVAVSNLPATQAISAASLPLPNGAASGSVQAQQLAAEQAIASSAAPLTGSPVVSQVVSISAGGVVTLFAATATRQHLSVVNLNPAGGADDYCTDDGSTPSSGNASFIVYAHGSVSLDRPAFVPNTAIQCTGSGPLKAEAF